MHRQHCRLVYFYNVKNVVTAAVAVVEVAVIDFEIVAVVDNIIVRFNAVADYLTTAFVKILQYQQAVSEKLKPPLLYRNHQVNSTAEIYKNKETTTSTPLIACKSSSISSSACTSPAYLPAKESLKPSSVSSGRLQDLLLLAKFLLKNTKVFS